MKSDGREQCNQSGNNTTKVGSAKIRWRITTECKFLDHKYPVYMLQWVLTK